MEAEEDKKFHQRVHLAKIQPWLQYHYIDPQINQSIQVGNYRSQSRTNIVAD